MAAVAPELDLDEPPLRDAPFLSRLQRRIEQYALLVRLDRPIGTWLLLWPALWGLWIAGGGRPHPRVLIVFVLGVFVMRAAGCVINDFADRNIDPHVRRTR
ncbi:MAG: UbiA family prenyltransferase, partial [Steroidobacteraceae bacterium]